LIFPTGVGSKRGPGSHPAKDRRSRRFLMTPYGDLVPSNAACLAHREFRHPRHSREEHAMGMTSWRECSADSSGRGLDRFITFGLGPAPSWWIIDWRSTRGYPNRLVPHFSVLAASTEIDRTLHGCSRPPRSNAGEFAMGHADAHVAWAKRSARRDAAEEGGGTLPLHA